MSEQMTVNVAQEDLYRFCLFAEELVKDYMKMGVRLQPEDMHKVLTVLYELRDASLRILPGETVDAQKPA